MGNALALIVVGGVFTVGVLMHFDHIIAAIAVGAACCAAVRWIIVHYV